MKSVVLCEGPDDLWFIAYYLHKSEGWDTCNANWSNYKITALNRKQQVVYLENGTNSVAIWCVAGKDGFKAAITTIFKKFIENFPFDPIDSMVIVRDRDTELTNEILLKIQDWIPGNIQLENKEPSIWEKEIDGYEVSLKITPVIIPFSEEGAIETLLMGAVKEQGREEEIIVQEANQYIDCLLKESEIGTKYLAHERLILKARYSAVISATNPGHSTGLFQDMVMACPWEKSSYIKDHFSAIVSAISSH